MTLQSPTHDKQHTKNMFIALVMCAALIVGWQFLVETPKRERLAEWQKQQQVLKAEQAKQKAVQAEAVIASVTAAASVPAPRVSIQSDTLHGGFSLRGLRFDALTLAQYKETLAEDSPEVELLKQASAELPYFMQFGWLSDDEGLRVPGADTVWQASQDKLSKDQPLTLEWNNEEGLTFYVTVSLDDHYMFTIDQQVFNQSGTAIFLKPYALINRAHESASQNYLISHEGPLGVLDGTLKEVSYDDIEEEKQSFKNSQGWLGFTDKYWLTALIPDQEQKFTGNFSSYQSKGKPRYQVDYVGANMELLNGERSRNRLHFFAGAKKVDILDHYTAGVDALNLAPVPLFDRAVDFGWLYFLTKPIFQALSFFYALVGNFGVAIILLTFSIKLLMFPLANKGYKSMTALRALQPEMARLKEKYADDRMGMQQELLALYKKEKVNPASGCLPMLIQLPVFFSLYKVLFVTIEMRHAPFWGPWRDLSAEDPTNLFTGFGLIPWDHPSFLALGILPILMTLSMIVQMRQQPKPQDPVQAKVMQLMPWFLLLIVAHMPAGLVLYWVVSNMLSILQQAVITRKYNATHPNKHVDVV